MSYSTMLYAVDIRALKSACGSNDSALIERVRAVLQECSRGGKRVDPTKGPRVRVTWKSDIYLNGNLVTRDEFLQALVNPEWDGTTFYFYQELNPPPGQQREGEFKVLGDFIKFVATTVAPYFQERGRYFENHYPQFQSVSSEAELETIDTPSAVKTPSKDFTQDQALEELVAGTCTQPWNAHAYGYALEQLCGGLGTFLDSVGTDRLKSLKLKTPLSKTRAPVKLPKIQDFPYISYLDTEELRAEVDRLRSSDLSYPSDTEVEEDRKYFLQLLEKAAEQNCGVVGFYY